MFRESEWQAYESEEVQEAVPGGASWRWLSKETGFYLFCPGEAPAGRWIKGVDDTCKRTRLAKMVQFGNQCISLPSWYIDIWYGKTGSSHLPPARESTIDLRLYDLEDVITTHEQNTLSISFSQFTLGKLTQPLNELGNPKIWYQIQVTSKRKENRVG